MERAGRPEVRPNPFVGIGVGRRRIVLNRVVFVGEIGSTAALQGRGGLGESDRGARRWPLHGSTERLHAGQQLPGRCGVRATRVARRDAARRGCSVADRRRQHCEDDNTAGRDEQSAFRKDSPHEADTAERKRDHYFTAIRVTQHDQTCRATPFYNAKSMKIRSKFAGFLQ